MTSRRSGPLGVQRPALELRPPAVVSSAGAEAVDLAGSCGLVLDDWQAYVVEVALGERRDGTWAAFEVLAEVARQNGKGGILEAVELAGAVLWGEQLIVHTAHLAETAMAAYNRFITLVESNPDVDRLVQRVNRSHGQEAVEFRNRCEVKFRTRSKGSGRGLTGDRVFLDECMYVDTSMLGALVPTMSARPNPQLWYTGSAPFSSSAVQHRVRGRVLNPRRGDRLAAFIWSAAPAGLEEGQTLDLDDHRLVALANPTLNRRRPDGSGVTSEFVRTELPAIGPVEFLRERLGVPEPPPPEADEDGSPIDADAWDLLADPESSVADGRVVFAIDSSPDRGWTSIAVAGMRDDGAAHVDLTDHRPGTTWVVDRLAQLVEHHGAPAVFVNPGSPAGAYVASLEAAGVPVIPLQGRQMAQAAQRLVDAVREKQLRHTGQPELASAVAGARKKDGANETWTWARADTSVVLCPVVAVSAALLGLELAEWPDEEGPSVW